MILRISAVKFAFSPFQVVAKRNRGGQVANDKMAPTKEILVPELTARELASLFAKDEEVQEIPNKRRKLSRGTSTPAEAGRDSVVSEGEDYIPLRRFNLDLKFENPNDYLGLSSTDYVDLPSSLPVLLDYKQQSPIPLSDDGRVYIPRTNTAKVIGKADNAVYPRLSTKKKPFERDYEPIQPGENRHTVLDLCLKAVQNKGAVHVGLFDEPDITDFFRCQLSCIGFPLSVDDKNKSPQSVCYQATLHFLSVGLFRLEVTVMWKNSQITPTVTLETELALSRILPHGRELNYFGGQHRPELPQDQWHPQDFYNSVHVPQDTEGLISCDQIRCELFPFQSRTVKWLLQREGVTLGPDGQVIPIDRTADRELPISFVEMKDADGRTCYVSHLFGIVTTVLSLWYDVSNLNGGILAEEMGLGKTVELLSLICLNPMPSPAQIGQPAADDEHLKISKATLIITPQAILEQWKQEIRLHAPQLRLFHYLGHDPSSVEEVTKEMINSDIVLTTYDVLRREIHFTNDVPVRSYRGGRRSGYEKTSLVRILWWRVCLDEAQMIGRNIASGVAKLAREVPRQNAWAVTGTPINRDIDDLLGLFVFLRYQPFCDSRFHWNRMHRSFHSECAKVVNSLTLRHNKKQVRSKLNLPHQKRVVITIPFNAIEEQHYGQLHEQMSEECGLDTSGAPTRDDWDPDDPAVVGKMRSWLTRLRQTCLHPEMGPGGHRIQGAKTNPLRFVSDVLELMIDQNDSQIRSEQRAHLQSQIRRGQLLENAMRSQEALDLWRSVLQRASEIVGACRDNLQLKLERCRAAVAENKQASAPEDDTSSDVDEEEEGLGKDNQKQLSGYRKRLQVALEVLHICTFFCGCAYYQIRMDPKQTEPGSEKFQDLEKREGEAYESAKQVRKELLTNVSGRTNRFMETVKGKVQNKTLARIPKMNPKIYSRGIRARDLIDRYEDFCDLMNKSMKQYDQWRAIITNLLLQPLIDQEEDELEGDEYEKSTKHQDEMYVYMEALRAMVADRSDAITGQKNTLVDHEVQAAVAAAKIGQGPSPNLFLSVMNTRSQLMPGPELGSLRGMIGEFRILVSSLESQEIDGSYLARAEVGIVDSMLKSAIYLASEQTRALPKLGSEIDLFRETMNSRLEYYRQLQNISDMVAPYDENSIGMPLNEDLFADLLWDEARMAEKISTLNARQRYLLQLRDEPESDSISRVCVICQSTFENGVLTVCGHKYCKDCLLQWWRHHRNCPCCKTRLGASSFYQITYKPKELLMQEEQPTRPGRPSKNSIYTDISSSVLREIKDVELNGSFGTKIDALSRHIIWLRQHDPEAKSIVFTQYRGMIRVLEAAFSHFNIGYSSVDSKGGIEKFKKDPTIECFLLHGKAQSSGLNLVNATHVFFCEPLINTAIELQTIARVHRIGQQHPTTVWMYLVSGTVEESIYNISVTRRLDHIIGARKSDPQIKSEEAAAGNPFEDIIDSANSLELQNATSDKLMAKSASEGEVVNKDDLWECLFGSPNRAENADQAIENQKEVERFLRGEAAEKRAEAASKS